MRKEKVVFKPSCKVKIEQATAINSENRRFLVQNCNILLQYQNTRIDILKH